MAPAASGKKVKKAIEGINSRLQLVMKSGKAALGYKTSIKAIRAGKSKVIKPFTLFYATYILISYIFNFKIFRWL